MTSYYNIFNENISQIQNEGRYREFITFKRQAGYFPRAINSSNNQEVIMWCINDYLGIGQHPTVLEVAKNTLMQYGIGSGGTRNIGGNNDTITELEEELAKLHSKDKALIFTSGYVANDAALSSLAKIMPDIAFFSDALNHASIIAGINNSRADKYIYRHTDAAHLEELLQKTDINRPKIIVFESAYSMDGLFSPVEEICRLAKKYNALTFIDEVHTVGLYGNGGAGFANMIGCEAKIDIIQGTLAKAYGAIGGYIAGDKHIIDAIRLNAPGFIFTTSLPPVIAKAATASIRYLKNSDAERKAHHETVMKVKNMLESAKINYFKNDSHIIPIIIGDPIKVKQISKRLLDEYQIYVQHINFPTVPKGEERLRIIPTPHHTDQMIEDLVKALTDVCFK